MSSRNHIVITFLAMFCLLLPADCQAKERQAESIAGIVASMLKAYGGTAAVRKVVSVTARGLINEFINGKTGNYARFLERPGMLRIEVMPEQGGEIRILKGDHGWQSGIPVSALELQSMIYQYSYLDLPMGLVDKELPVTSIRKELYKGQEAYLLLIEPVGAPSLRVLVDASSRLIVRVAASFSMGMMGASELSTEYGDYRAVEGVLFPFRLINFAGDMKISEISLHEIMTNQKIPAALFASP